MDQLIHLSIESVKQIFKDNGFRFLPDLLLPKLPYADDELVPYYALPAKGGGQNMVPFLRGSKLTSISLAVDQILQGKSLVEKVWSCIYKLGDLAKDFFTNVPLSGKIYLAAKGAFLALNITSVQFTVVRYSI